MPQDVLVNKLVIFSRPRPSRLRRGLVALFASLGVLGSSILAYPSFTHMQATRAQQELETDFASGASTYEWRRPDLGGALARLQIPRLGVNVIVVEGTTPAALRAGAGHYPSSPLPGDFGNSAIAGHRTTYGKPFNRIDELEVSDEIVITTPTGWRHRYSVVGQPWVVEPTDWSPIRDYPQWSSWLTLTSCEPEGSDVERIVVRAELIASRRPVLDTAQTLTPSMDPVQASWINATREGH